jgi:adenylate cyclase class IV
VQGPRRNIEVKCRCTDLVAVRERAEALGATDAGVLHQDDTFFDAPQARLKLRDFGDGAAELISYRRADTVQARASDFFVCPIADPSRLRATLAHALPTTGSVRKRRHLFFYRHTRIHLDDVEGLGAFVELGDRRHGAVGRRGARGALARRDGAGPEARRCGPAPVRGAAAPPDVTPSILVVQLLSGLAKAMVLFLIASGLTLIFGVTRVVNFAHGSLYMLAAYLTYSLTSALPLGAASFYVAVLAASLAVGALGLLIEVGLLRRVYKAPELYQLLLTFALVLVLSDVVKLGWGSENKTGPSAPGLAGSVPIAGQLFPSYDPRADRRRSARGARPLVALLPDALGRADPRRHPGSRDGRGPRRGPGAAVHRRLRARVGARGSRRRAAGAASAAHDRDGHDRSSPKPSWWSSSAAWARCRGRCSPRSSSGSSRRSACWHSRRRPSS